MALCMDPVTPSMLCRVSWCSECEAELECDDSDNAVEEDVEMAPELGVAVDEEEEEEVDDDDDDEEEEEEEEEDEGLEDAVW